MTTTAAEMKVVPMASVELWGCMPSGELVHKISLQSRVNGKVTGASVITRGAAVQEVLVPDKDGKMSDVVLGFDDLRGYHEGKNFCYGGTPGRYANRISRGSFQLEGEQCSTTQNWAGASGATHTLHGGAAGFDGKVWEIAQGPWVDKDGAHVTLRYRSAAGEEGFPGNLVATTTYTWHSSPDGSIGELRIGWEATTDATTVVNLTNHTYFNLSGVESASKVLDTHTCTLNCDTWTEVNEDAIPSGKLLEVGAEGNTAMDFRQPKLLGQDIGKVPGAGEPQGYDHNFVVNGTAEAPGMKRFVGRIDCTSGRRLECWATQPGVQLFTMQPKEVFDMATNGKFGQVYPVNGGVCLETQHFPDSPNQPSFPSTAITPGCVYRESCSYRFSVC